MGLIWLTIFVYGSSIHYIIPLGFHNNLLFALNYTKTLVYDMYIIYEKTS